MIYLDNAATTAHKPEEVARAVYEAIASGHLGNPARGAHDYALAAFRVIYRCREAAAELLGVDDPLRIALTANATDGLNRVLKGLLGSGDHVISTVTEHNSVLRPLYQLEAQGMELDLVGIDARAHLVYDDFERYLRKNTKAVVATAASNVTGNPTDLPRLARFCRTHGLLFIVDASQAAGVFDLNLKQLGIDVLVATGHKSLYGPQGTGLVAVGRDLAFRPVFSGGSGAHSFDREHPVTLPDVLESGTLNTPGAAGLTAGIEYLRTTGLADIRARLNRLTGAFLEGVRDIPNLRLYGDPDMPGRAPVIGLNLGDLPSSEVAALLNEDYGIAVRPGAHCAPRLHEALRTREQGIVRFSFSPFNTIEEIHEAVAALKDLSTMTGGTT